MVTSCIAYGCTNRVKKGSDISFHRFPIKRLDLLQKWIQAVRRKNWIPHENSYICSAHFPESCFCGGEGKLHPRLDKNAVLSIFPQFPKHLQIIEKKKRKSPAKRKIIEKPYQPSPSKVAKAVSLVHPYMSCESAERKILRLTKQNEALYQRLCQREKKIKNMMDLLQSLKDKQLILDEQLQNLNQNFGHVAQHLFVNYAKNVKKSNPHASHYSKETKQFAMTLHYYSPKGYDFV